MQKTEDVKKLAGAMAAVVQVTKDGAGDEHVGSLEQSAQTEELLKG